MWCKALPKAPSCLSVTAWLRIPAGVCEKVASDLGLGGGFRLVLPFPQSPITGWSRQPQNHRNT